MANNTIVARLPTMESEDLARFETEGGVWGQQRAIRRQQASVAVLGGVAAFAVSGAWVMSVRKNTGLVALCTAPCFGIFGAVAGNALGVAQFPSVACNKETTMMKRVWWAKQCSANWDMSQLKGDDVWEAKHPKSTFLKQ